MMRTEPWQWIIFVVLTAAIFVFAQDLVAWTGLAEAPFREVKKAIYSLILAAVGAGIVYRFFAWVGSIPSEDPRQRK